MPGSYSAYELLWPARVYTADPSLRHSSPNSWSWALSTTPHKRVCERRKNYKLKREAFKQFSLGQISENEWALLPQSLRHPHDPMTSLQLLKMGSLDSNGIERE